MTYEHDFFAPADEGPRIRTQGEQARHTLTSVGDTMQSEASRLLEWVEAEIAKGTIHLPYEVHMAGLALDSAIDQWTELRKTEPKRHALTQEDWDA
jgi:hypothetical protein